MMTRILIVVLAILNLGVVLWTIFQPTVDISTTAPTLTEGAQLELFTPSDSKTQAISVPHVTPHSALQSVALIASELAVDNHTVAVERQKIADHCSVIAGFATKEAALAARARLSDLPLTRVDVRLSQGGNELYQVVLAVNGNRRAVQETIAHLVSAGIDDIFLKGKINQQWMIALGQYRQRDGALRRQSAILAAGMTPIIQQFRQKIAADRWELFYQSNASDEPVKKRFPNQTVHIEKCEHG